MKQTITLLLFILAFSSQSFASQATIVPMVTTTTHTIDIAKKDGVFIKAAKWVKKAVKSAANLDGKTIALIAHLFGIGLLLAYIFNKESSTEIGSFYIRQNLGILILGVVAAVAAIVLAFIPFGFLIGWALYLLVLVLWIISLLNALGEKMKPVPVFGKMFQNWFASI